MLPELLPAIVALMTARHTGTVHMVNPGTISLHQLRVLASPAGDTEWERVAAGDAVDACRKKPMVVLDDEFVRRTFPHVREIHDAVKHGLAML